MTPTSPGDDTLASHDLAARLECIAHWSPTLRKTERTVLLDASRRLHETVTADVTAVSDRPVS